jgi:hypothetical protein
MTVTDEHPDLSTFRDIRSDLGQLEDRITLMEHRMASLEQHLSALLDCLGWGSDPLEAPHTRFDRIEFCLEPTGGP